MFGMTINVGMVVHDKINLQNAVDFASIYVAQRQAEMLNAIAHFNYQIRQSHKLLAYRYVVLGTAAIDPNRTVSNRNEELDPSADKIARPACFSDDKLMIFPLGSADQWCSDSNYRGGLPELPVLPVVNGGLGGNYGLRDQTVALIREISNQVAVVSTINWWFTANIMASFKTQIAYRKAMIRALATNLARPITAGAEGMKDLYGQSVYEGARKTFEFNLSESARRSGGYSIEIRNSLAGTRIQQWLPEIPIIYLPVYADKASYTSPITSQFYTDRPRTSSGFSSTIDALMDQLDPRGGIQSLMSGFFASGHIYEDILGFEKNPWYMVYNEVRGRSVSGALFSPTSGLMLQAQAFSKPFGGTIGPWYGRNWPQGSATSSDEKVEPLWPNRHVGGGRPTSGDPSLLPNSSKYPGDRLGMKSHLAQASTGWLGGRHSSGTRRFHVNEYLNITYNLFPGSSGQALAWDENSSLAENYMYRRELAAIAPDLFDITYYSIEPNFDENYLDGKLDTWLVNEANPFLSDTGYTYSETNVWRDFGFSTRRDQQNFSVKDQIMIGRNEIPNITSRDVFYYLDPANDGIANILTSWVGGMDVMDYRSPTSASVNRRFGKCQTFYTSGNGRPNVPGTCLNNGGRTGYSVKLVSKNYLLSNQHRMSPGSAGSILNPPTN